jgi:hypothetical protein
MYHNTGPTRMFSNIDIKQQQSHLLLDFQAGKDVGLGFLGRHSSSVLSFGVRVAQFSSRMSSTIHAVPTETVRNVFGNNSQFYAPTTSFHAYTGSSEAWRSFHGIGPSLSWKMSAAIAGHEDSMSLNIDGGVNASLLFGRQRAGSHHQTTGYFMASCNCDRLPTYTRSGDVSRSRSVTIPNLGAFGSVSLKFPNAKVSLGYRGDFFLDAMDTGIDTRKTKTVGYYGPFASISIGFRNGP